jgi:hypothetical protein
MTAYQWVILALIPVTVALFLATVWQWLRDVPRIATLVELWRLWRMGHIERRDGLWRLTEEGARALRDGVET